MKIELVKIDGKISGYNLLAENAEEQTALDAIKKIYEEEIRCGDIEMVQDAFSKLKFIADKYAPHDLKSLERVGAITHELVEEKNETTYTCSECGSSDVEIMAWVKPNENSRYSGDVNSPPERDDCWCCNCESHCYLEETEEKEAG